MKVVFNILTYNTLLALVLFLIYIALKRKQEDPLEQFKPRFYNDYGKGGAAPTGGRFLTRNDWIIMGSMSLIYAIVALINLGGFKAPETWWKPAAASNSVVFDLGSQHTLSRIGYNPNAMQHTENENYFDIYYQDDTGNFVSANKQMSGKNFFRWEYVDLDITTSKIKLVPIQGTRLDGQQTGYGYALNEVAFFEKDTQALIGDVKLVNAPEGAAALMDEQDTAVYNANSTDSSFFDEVYFVRTGYEFLHGYRVYETTHPPLGKDIIAAAIWLFGMVPFAWRILSMLTGVLMIPLMYIFAKKLLNSTFFAFFAAFLMMFDFMHFVQTRIGTVDGFMTIFIILMYYFMYNYFTSDALQKDHKYAIKQLYLCGLMFGLGISVKWIALYGAAGLFFVYVLAGIINTRDHVGRLRTDEESRRVVLNMGKIILLSILFFIAIPLAIYLLSYIPYYLAEGNEGRNFFQVVWGSQTLMFGYHSKLTATHPYMSSWWSWPLDIRPMKYYLGNTMKENISSSITAFGNPIIWWTGICSVFAALFIAWKKADKKMVVIFAALLFQYAPWTVITRAAFIYHFFSSLPFMFLCMAYVAKHLYDNKLIGRKIIYGWMALAFAAFVLYFPLLSAMEVPRSFILKLNIFTTWPF